MFDSRAIAAKAALSPVQLNRTLRTDDQNSMLDSTIKVGEEAGLQREPHEMHHDSHLLLPTTKNFILPKRLTVSPKRMKVFHGHTIDGDNSVNTDLKANKRQI